ncbi:hypothetical protein [Coleofasciculus sp. FACHB-SPT36]|uniref:hypothetical protein n=1 Tax=Cyanophyceae TaxID=3028117 RepID=UPI00168AF351|nr:hypothetical protein [Coleofasciculus sp. FACHB-SPT36]MBD2540078.1 hypothetical protein [Coleofasciculus sp. FACHB-SPT36]
MKTKIIVNINQAKGCAANVADTYFCERSPAHLLHFLPAPVAWASALRSRFWRLRKAVYFGLSN